MEAKKQPLDLTSPKPLLDFMLQSWATAEECVSPLWGREHFAARRAEISRRFPAVGLLVPTGGRKTRANDTSYRFRPGSDFYYLTGFDEPYAVLLLLPAGSGHREVLFVVPSAGRTDTSFFTDHVNGEMWIGRRQGLSQLSKTLGIEVRDLKTLPQVLVDAAERSFAALRGLDVHIDALVPANATSDLALATALSELRLIKDDFEIEELRSAIASTKRGFEDVLRAFPVATERVVEGVFNLRARVEGNDVGYNTIAASGANACVLHWRRNNREISFGDLLLLDAGVEGPSLYTADITHNVPVSGRFSREQRELYTLVWRAQAEAFAQCRPGNDFLDPHRAAMRVLAKGLEELGVLKSVSEALDPENQLYKRYTLHNTSHMLGLDVHDCAAAREEDYRYGTLRPGMVLTVEPGLYFQQDDLTVPEPYRGIGIRIEDDVVITRTGYSNLSEAIPRDPDEVEAWVQKLRGTSTEAWVRRSAVSL